MKSVTIDLSESVVDDLEDYARRMQRPTEDVLREAIEAFRRKMALPVERRKSLSEHPVFSVGKILKPLGPDDDLLEEMLDGRI